MKPRFFCAQIPFIGIDLGVEIHYVSTEAANRIEYLQTGKVDIILANFTVTEERAQEVDFALPYMNVTLRLAKDGSTMLIVTHDMTFAKTIADRVLFLEHGEIMEESIDAKKSFEY